MRLTHLRLQRPVLECAHNFFPGTLRDQRTFGHRPPLGSGLVDHSQKMTVAARAIAEKKAVGQRS